MWTPVYYVRLVPLPAKVDGLTVPNDDGSFDIYLNADHCEARRQEHLKHEIDHIFEDHFYQETKSITAIEQEANSPAAHTPPPVPHVFREAPAGTIPFFSSLDSFGKYIFAMRDQQINSAPHRSAG